MEHHTKMSTWNGELAYVDDEHFREASFNAWLSWEFMQRCVSGYSEECAPSEMGQLCGKKTVASRSVVHRALKHARCNA